MLVRRGPALRTALCDVIARTFAFFAGKQKTSDTRTYNRQTHVADWRNRQRLVNLAHHFRTLFDIWCKALLAQRHGPSTTPSRVASAAELRVRFSRAQCIGCFA